MHDNARPQAAGIVLISFMPSQNLDLNPIEHMWDQLKRWVRRTNPVPSVSEELRITVQKKWNATLQEHIHTLVSSMPRRMQGVISVRRVNAPY